MHLESTLGAGTLRRPGLQVESGVESLTSKESEGYHDARVKPVGQPWLDDVGKGLAWLLEDVSSCRGGEIGRHAILRGW